VRVARGRPRTHWTPPCNRKEPAMSKTMQRVSLDTMAREAFKSGATIEFDDEQNIAYLDVSRTLTMYATLEDVRDAS
jgi:hypothetical protein